MAVPRNGWWHAIPLLVQVVISVSDRDLWLLLIDVLGGTVIAILLLFLGVLLWRGARHTWPALGAWER